MQTLKSNRRSDKILYWCGATFLLSGSLLPYKTSISWEKVNSSSKPFEYAPELYQTTLGIQHSWNGISNIIIFAILSTLYFFGKRYWLKYFLIPIGIYYSLILLYELTTFFVPMGRPVGDSPEIGFVLMLAGTILTFIAIIKNPSLKRSTNLQDF